jgi:hypothetical protein
MEEEKSKTEAQKRRRQLQEEATWTILRDLQYVEDALLKDSLEEAVEVIIDAYDEFNAAFGGRSDGRSQGGDRRTDTVDVALSDLELERQAALEEYLAMCATCDIDVYRFRERVLEGDLLAENEARDLLKSPAAALIESRLFKWWKIPFVGHTAQVNSYARDLVPPGFAEYTATIAVDPPGTTYTVGMPTLANIAHADEQRPVVLEFPDEQGRIVGREVWSISLLGQLRELGKKLSDRYRWQPAQAVWFVALGPPYE